MSAVTYSKSGSKATTQIKLDPAVFGAKEINHNLLAYAYQAYLANGRDNIAVTKTRGLVSGGGKKPWRQKGTGRARVGSSRTPVWRGGGVVFGPKGNENFSKKLNLKAKHLALIQALTLLNREGKIKVIEDLSFKDHKTSELNMLLNKIGASGYILIAVDNLTDGLKNAVSNLSGTRIVSVKYLNVARLLDTDTLLITKSALKEIAEWLNPKLTESKAEKA